MAENCYELYRMKNAPGLQSYRLRPYRYLREHGVRIKADDYDLVLRGDILPEENAKDIRKRLEHMAHEGREVPVRSGCADTEDKDDEMASLCISIGDVLAVTREGITAAYYVDPTRLILIPDFFCMPADGALITVDTENCPLDGRKGSWMTVDSMMIDHRLYFLMQSMDYGRDAPYVVVDEQGREYAADKDGFTEVSIEQVRKVAAELAAQKAGPNITSNQTKPKLEVWQQYLENGEYLRAAEITEEQNYNMIDGKMNNRAPKRSVIERLQEKQTEVKQGFWPIPSPERAQDSEIERNRK